MNFSVIEKVKKMNKARVEAFTDAIVAIVMTIMVLEIKIPHEAGWMAL